MILLQIIVPHPHPGTRPTNAKAAPVNVCEDTTVTLQQIPTTHTTTNNFNSITTSRSLPAFKVLMELIVAFYYIGSYTPNSYLYSLEKNISKTSTSIVQKILSKLELGYFQYPSAQHMITMLDSKMVSTGSSFPKYSKMKKRFREESGGESDGEIDYDSGTDVKTGYDSGTDVETDDMDESDDDDDPPSSKRQQTDTSFKQQRLESQKMDTRKKIYEEIKDSTENLLQNPIEHKPSLFMGGVLIWNGLNTLASLEGLGGPFLPIEQVSEGYKSFLLENGIVTYDPMQFGFPGKNSRISSLTPQERQMQQSITNVNKDAERRKRVIAMRNRLLKHCKREIALEDLKKDELKKRVRGQKLTEGTQITKEMMESRKELDKKLSDILDDDLFNDDLFKDLDSKSSLDKSDFYQGLVGEKAILEDPDKIKIPGIKQEQQEDKISIQGPELEGGGSMGSDVTTRKYESSSIGDDIPSQKKSSFLKINKIGKNTYFVSLK